MKLTLLGTLLLTLVSTSSYAATPGSIRDLIVLGLQNNIGLQVEKINIPLGAEEIQIESASFDTELFADTAYTEQSTPQSITLDELDTENFSAQTGLRKKFQFGLTSSISLRSHRSTDNTSIDSLDPRYRTALLLDLTQPLLRDFGSATNTTQLQVLQNQQRQTSYQYFFLAQQLTLQIETLALQFAGQTEIVKLRKEAVELAKSLLLANQKRFDSGVIPVSEVQEAETDLANRELNLSLAAQSSELTLQRLNRQLDHQLSTDFSAEAIYRSNRVDDAQITLNLLDVDQLFTAAKQKRLDLKVSHLEIENRYLQKSFYKNQQRAKLDLKLQAGIDGLSGKQRDTGITNPYSGDWGDSFSSMADAEGYQWLAGLEFSMPLGNRSAKSRLAQAVLRERQSSYRKQDLESALKDELLQQQTLLQRTAEQFGIADRFRKLAEKSFQQEKRRLEEGLSDTFRLILFQNNMINAKIDRITALTQYHQSVAQMNYSRGIILEQHGITVQAGAEEAYLESM